jgi:hypothetical protein
MSDTDLLVRWTSLNGLAANIEDDKKRSTITIWHDGKPKHHFVSMKGRLSQEDRLLMKSVIDEEGLDFPDTKDLVNRLIERGVRL